jgi:multidrug resistance efflux pump
MSNKMMKAIGRFRNKIYFLLAVVVLAAMFFPYGSLGASTTSPAHPAQESQPAVQEWSAQGRLVPKSWVNLSFIRSGLVDQLLVKEGDPVAAGESLATQAGLEKTTAQVAAAELELVNGQQALDDLNRNAGVALAQAELRLAELQKAEQRARDKAAGLSKPVDQQRIAVTRANMLSAKQGLDNMLKDQDRLEKFLNDKNNIIWRFIPTRPFKLKLMYLQLQVTLAQKKYNDVVDRYNDLTEPMDPVDLQQAQADLDLASAQVQQAMQDRDKLANGPDPDDLAATQARVNAAQAALDAAQATYTDLKIIAPFAGQVVSIPAKQNQWARAGQPALVLADKTGWMVEIDALKEKLVPAVEVGQAVRVTFDALPEQEFDGRVESIGLLNGEKNGDVVYKVKISLQEDNPMLRWGMTARVSGS